MSRWYFWGLVAAYLVMYIAPLGVRPMITPDEFRYGEVAREILESGDWVVPRLNGVRYFEKPILGYWLNAVAIWLFGENGFAVRLSSALSTGISAWLVWFVVRRSKHDEELALLSAGIFLTCGLVFGVGTFAVLDAPTSLFLTAAMFFFFIAAETHGRPVAKIWYLVLFGVSCGLAFLTKGFLAFVVPGLAIAAWLIWSKRWKDILLLPWIPLAAAVAVVLPWALAIHWREADYWHYFVVVEHWERFLGKNESQHPEGFWFYIPIFFGGLMPWTLLLPPALFFCWKHLRKMTRDPLFRFSLCSLVFPFLFFSACSGKLGTYILPCFPAVAIMMAYLLREMFQLAASNRYYVWYAKILAAVLVVAAIGFSTAQLIADAGFYHGLYAPDEWWKWLAAVGGGLVSMVCLLASIRSTDYRKRLMWLVLFAVPPFAVSLIATPIRPIDAKAQGMVLSKWRELVPEDAVIVAHPNVIHAAAWEWKHRNINYYGSAGEMTYGVNHPDSIHRLIDREKLQQMIRKTPPGKLIYLIRGDFREGVPPAPVERYDHDIMFSRF